jgi:hypothetical protein
MASILDPVRQCASICLRPSYKAIPTVGAMQTSFLSQVHRSSQSPPAWNCTPPCPLMVSTRAGPILSQFDEDLDGSGYGGDVRFGVRLQQHTFS